MATDSFTNSDGTALSTHDAAWTKGNGYTGSCTIQSNQCRGPDFVNTCYFYSGSGSDDSQIVKKAYSALGNNRFGVTVRTTTGTLGYRLTLGTLSGDNFTFANVYKGSTSIGGSTAISVSRLSDITMRIQATANGSDQEIRIWVNGTQLTFGSSSGGASHSGMVLTDPSANSPLTTGDPGFFISSSAAQAENYFDDWDDLVSGGGAAPTITDAGDETFVNGETGIVITGENFGATQGTVKICPTDDVDDANAVSQTVTAWGTTSATITAVRGSLALNTNLYLFVIADGGASNAAGYVVQITGDKKIKLLLNSASVGATVDGVVFEAPVSGIVGAKIGEFTGATIAAGTGADAGYAVLKVPVADFGGGALNVNDTVRCYVKNATNFTPIWVASVIEE